MPAPSVETATTQPTAEEIMNTAVAHHQSGNWNEADRLYRAILADNPKHAHAQHNLGILLMQTRRAADALPYLEAAVDTSPAPRYWLSYVDGLLQAGRIAKARHVVAAAVRHGLRGDSVKALSARLDRLAQATALDPAAWMPDLTGDVYTRVLERLHTTLSPDTYLEIGVETGATLALARCASIGIDPRFQLGDIQVVQRMAAKPRLLLYQTPSDDFFSQFSPSVLFGAPVDLSFLDGMHRCEYLLRDFNHTEKHCRPGSVIALHDCLPLEGPMADREPNADAIDPQRQGMWTGDVWRTALLLKRRRPDLRMLVLDAPPTGLVLLTHLDPQNVTLADNHDALVEEMQSWSLESISLPGYYEEIGVKPEIHYRQAEDLRAWIGGETPRQ